VEEEASARVSRMELQEGRNRIRLQFPLRRYAIYDHDRVGKTGRSWACFSATPARDRSLHDGLREYAKDLG
jgi:hypothetical protein